MVKAKLTALEQLRALKPELPEIECYVPDWKRKVTLRGFTVREGRLLRKELDPKADQEAFGIKAVAHAISKVEGLEFDEDRPLANADGIAAIESLSEIAVRRLMEAFSKLTEGEEAVSGNSGGLTAKHDASSSVSLSRSAEPSPNSKPN